MKTFRTAYFDCYSGISGDMILGALVDLGVNVKDIRKALKKIDLTGYKLQAKKVQRNGLSCTQITVVIDKSKHHDSHSHRSFTNIRRLIENSGLPIKVKSNSKNLEVSIDDDGPGFPDDVREILGQPYIKSKSRQVSSNAGTGLGTFLGKTLLERKSAKLSFSKNDKFEGARVNIVWNKQDLKFNV